MTGGAKSHKNSHALEMLAQDGDSMKLAEPSKRFYNDIPGKDIFHSRRR